MNSKRINRQPSKASTDGHQQSEGSTQGNLWDDREDAPLPAPPNCATSEPPGLAQEISKPHRAVKDNSDRRTIQDLLFQEGLLAARLAQGVNSLDELQTQLINQLPQN